MSNDKFEAKTVAAALEQAAAKFDVPVDELQHEVVDEKTDDFWGLGEKVVVIRAWVEGAADPEPEPVAPPAPRQQAPRPEREPAAPPAAAPVAEPARPARPAPPKAPPAASAKPTVAAAGDAVPAPIAALETVDDLPAAAVQLLDRIFEMMDFDCTTAAQMEGETLQVGITGEDNQYLLDGRGRGLSALELILNHAFRHRIDAGHRKIRVDAGDFRSQRDDELRDLAFQVAHRAKETHTEQQTRPLNPYERRIVHLTLADDSAVTTRSLGNGFTKAVNVIPRSSGNR